MIRTIAIDDEAGAIGVIREFARRIPDLELVETFIDPTKALQYTSNGRSNIDLVFLDIQMNRMNGITVAGHLPPSTRIILTTAYPDFALQGYEMDVIDYLLKPFSFGRFERAIQKARSIIPSSRPGGAPGSGELSGVVEAPGPGERAPVHLLTPGMDDFIFVRTDYKTVKVKISEILYIEGSGNYVILHLVKGRIMVLQNLKKFEEQLLPYQFVRIHKSFIISFAHIDAIEKGWIRIGQEEVPIGEAYRDPFQKFLNEHYRQF